jgi:uncharacterized protein YbaR (Trm112 family)
MADFLSELSALLRCPVTGQQLHLATPEEFRAIPHHASHEADGFLVREDGTAAYPVKNGIPTLLEEATIGLAPADLKAAVTDAEQRPGQPT